MKAELDALAGEIQPRLFSEYEKRFHEGFEVPQIAFQGVYLAELLRLAAILAIDIGMKAEPFHAAAVEAWDTADETAPRFG